VLRGGPSLEHAPYRIVLAGSRPRVSERHREVDLRIEPAHDRDGEAERVVLPHRERRLLPATVDVQEPALGEGERELGQEVDRRSGALVPRGLA
jgi:hypothetical protein